MGGSGDHDFELVFEHTEDTVNTDFSYVWCLRTHTRWPSCLRGCYSGHLMFWGDFTKPIISNANVDRFYRNLVVGLQLDVLLLTRNFIKIRHWLTELWKCSLYYFFRTRCGTVPYFSPLVQFGRLSWLSVSFLSYDKNFVSHGVSYRPKVSSYCLPPHHTTYLTSHRNLYFAHKMQHSKTK